MRISLQHLVDACKRIGYDIIFLFGEIGGVIGPALFVGGGRAVGARNVNDGDRAF